MNCASDDLKDCKLKEVDKKVRFCINHIASNKDLALVQKFNAINKSLITMQQYSKNTDVVVIKIQEFLDLMSVYGVQGRDDVVKKHLEACELATHSSMIKF